MIAADPSGGNGSLLPRPLGIGTLGLCRSAQDVSQPSGVRVATGTTEMIRELGFHCRRPVDGLVVTIDRLWKLKDHRKRRGATVRTLGRSRPYSSR